MMTSVTPWCRVLLEQLTGLQLVKKFPAFHGTRRFITALTSVRHLSLFWASPIQSTCPHPTSWRSILICSFEYLSKFSVICWNFFYQQKAEVIILLVTLWILKLNKTYIAKEGFNILYETCPYFVILWLCVK